MRVCKRLWRAFLTLRGADEMEFMACTDIFTVHSHGLAIHRLFCWFFFFKKKGHALKISSLIPYTGVLAMRLWRDD